MSEREWQLAAYAVNALKRARSVFPDSLQAGPEGKGYAHVWNSCTDEEQRWVKAELLALSEALAELVTVVMSQRIDVSLN